MYNKTPLEYMLDIRIESDPAQKSYSLALVWPFLTLMFLLSHRQGTASGAAELRPRLTPSRCLLDLVPELSIPLEESLETHGRYSL